MKTRNIAEGAVSVLIVFLELVVVLDIDVLAEEE
jgi:hypothetical protein